MEIRSTPAAVLDRPKGEELLTELTGRAVPYNVTADIGIYLERFAPGSFRESIAHTPNVPLLTYHDDRRHPVGVAVQWTERSDGLYGRWTLDSSPDAQEAARLVKAGMLNFLSIRFQPDASADRWTVSGDRDLVTRSRARLLEVSLVNTPAYADATVSSIRLAPRSSALLLAEDLGVPLLVRAIDGTNEDQAVTAGLVRSFVDEYGTRAPAELAELAPVAALSNPILGLNLARSAAALEDADPALIRQRHLEAHGVPRQPPSTLPRRRRR